MIDPQALAFQPELQVSASAECGSESVLARPFPSGHYDRERLLGGTRRETCACELGLGPNAWGSAGSCCVVSGQDSSLHTQGAPGASQALSGRRGALYCWGTHSGREDTQVEATHPVDGALIESREL